MPFRARVEIVICVILLAVAQGCAKQAAPTEDEQTADLRQIARAYGVAISMHNKPPKDLETIKDILVDLHQAKLGEAPEDVLTSSRDGQPYVIVFGVQLGNDSTEEIFLYEKKGTSGTRYVMTLARVVRQVTDQEFALAKFAKGHKPVDN